MQVGIREAGSISGLERSAGGGHGNALQSSCLKNPWTEEPGDGSPQHHTELDRTATTYHARCIRHHFNQIFQFSKQLEVSLNSDPSYIADGNIQWGVCVCVCVCVLVAQSCLTLCNPMNCSVPGSSNHGILQARMLEWETIPFSRGSSQPRD